MEFLQQQGVPAEAICPSAQRLKELKNLDTSARCEVREWEALMAAAETALQRSPSGLDHVELKPRHAGLLGFWP